MESWCFSVTKEPVPQLQRQDISLNNNSKVSAQTSAGPKQLGGTIRPGNRTDQSASAVKLRMYVTSLNGASVKVSAVSQLIFGLRSVWSI